jgi:hypothetical protein
VLNYLGSADGEHVDSIVEEKAEKLGEARTEGWREAA